MVELGEARRIGTTVRQEVKDKADEYLKLLTPTAAVGNLSEYVGPQMSGFLSRYALEKYFSALSRGEINTEHGYDDDRLTRTVVSEIENLTACKKAVIVPSGTAANLCLITSFVEATSKKGNSSRFIAWSGEHTVSTEGEMLSRTGLREEDIIKIISPDGNGILSISAISTAVNESGSRPFIVQIAIPTVLGVVPKKEQVRELADYIHGHGGKFLVDGARLTNALAFWKEDLSILSKLGVDGFTLGSSKKGGIAETVCISDTTAAGELIKVAKSFGHISSKTSPLAYVTGLFFTTEWWSDEALSENRAAQVFARKIRTTGIEPVFPVQTNTIFVKLSKREELKLAGDRRFGLVYADYDEGGPAVDPNIARIVFTSYLSDEEILSRADALIEVKNKKD